MVEVSRCGWSCANRTSQTSERCGFQVRLQAAADLLESWWNFWCFILNIPKTYQNEEESEDKKRNGAQFFWSLGEWMGVASRQAIAWTRLISLLQHLRNTWHLRIDFGFRPFLVHRQGRAMLQSWDTSWSGETNVPRDQAQRKLMSANNMLQLATHILGWKHSHIYFREMHDASIQKPGCREFKQKYSSHWVAQHDKQRCSIWIFSTKRGLL